MDIRDQIRIFVLENAIKFDGKANQGAVVGKILALDPANKARMKQLSSLIADVVKDVNSLSPDEQKKQFTALDTTSVIRHREKKDNAELRDLPGTDKPVIMRFEPSPSGPFHVGHVYPGSLNYLYVKRYGGKLILRISDTNADNIYPDAYDLLWEDAKWLWYDVTLELMIQSDRMDSYYDYARRAITKGSCYVCTCSPAFFAQCKEKKEDCPCRGRTVSEQLARWQKMLAKDGYHQGDAVVRFKTSMEHKNPAFRDFPVLRINETPHERKGTQYKVWPLMMWAVAIDDMTTGVTHVLRGKDHRDNAAKQAMIYEAFGKEAPHSDFVGMINFEGLPLSSTKVRAMIKEGRYGNWDDIRLPFIPALRRRGYSPEAFHTFARHAGLSGSDKTMEGADYFKMLDAFDKDIIDEKTDRYFFVQSPNLVTIEGFSGGTFTLDLHPTMRKGGRTLRITDKVYIDAHDKIRAGEIVRLIDAITLKGATYLSDSYEEYKSRGGKKIIQYVPYEEHVKAHVLLPDNTRISGLAEATVKALKAGTVVQFERFGFCRLDRVDEYGYHFWYLHK